MTIGQLIEKGTISLDTEVLGELPITADGCVIGIGATVFPRADFFIEEPDDEGIMHPCDEQGGKVELHLRDLWSGDTLDPSEWNPLMNYSTREAAEAARSKA